MTPDFRRFLLLVGGLYVLTAAYLLVNGLALFPGDYIGWFYPFRGHEPFNQRGPFLDSLGHQDVVNNYLPFRAFVGATIAQGHFPWWNPLEGTGLPPGALHTNGSYFPLHWISYSLFSPLAAWHVDLTIQYFTGALGGYLLFRRWLGNTRAATLAALAWLLAGWHGGFFLAPPFAWPLALLPIVFLGLDDISKGRSRGAPMVALGIAASLLVGHLQITVAAALVISGHILAREGKNKGKMLLACTSGVLMASPHLLQLFELADLSNRPSMTQEATLSLLLAPRELLGLVFQNIMGTPADGFYLGRSLSSLVVDGREHAVYGGLLIAVLAIVGATNSKTRNNKLVVALVLLGLLFASSPLAYGTLTKLLPGLLFLTPTRFLPFAILGMCYLAGLGWKHCETLGLSLTDKVLIGLFLGLATLGVSTFVFRGQDFVDWLLELVKKDGLARPPYFEGNFGQVFLQRVTAHFSLDSIAIFLPLFLMLSGLLVALYIKDWELKYRAFTCLLLLDLGVYFFAMNTPLDKGLFFPELPEIKALSQGTRMDPSGATTPRRVIGLGRGIHPSMLLPYGIANFECYQSLLPGHYRSLFDKLNPQMPLSYIIASTTTAETLHSGLLDLFGVAITYDQPSEEERREGTSNLFIQTRETALRAFLLSSWELSTDNGSIYEPDFDPRKSALLASEPGFPSHPEPHFREVEPTFYGYNEVQLEVETDLDCILVLNDLDYPGWTARVNGQASPIIRAYGFCRAVALKPGKSVVVMTYRPRWLSLFIVCFLTGLSLLLGLVLTLGKKH